MQRLPIKQTGRTSYSRYYVMLSAPHNRVIFEPKPEAATSFKEGKTSDLTLIAASDHRAGRFSDGYLEIDAGDVKNKS